MNWWNQLDKTAGSRARCVNLTHGPRSKVAANLTALVNLPDVVVSEDHQWMPCGRPQRWEDGTWDTSSAKEARLDEPNNLIAPEIQQELKMWWLAVARRANTPNWDIVSTCEVDSAAGLLLIEAKAHRAELDGEFKGKHRPTTLNGWENHRTIGRAIADAAAELQFATGKPWAISRDSHYQLSNRFAWAWKLASLGIPVVLMYLGFLNAREMPTPRFRDGDGWTDALRAHCEGVVPDIWEARLDLEGVPLFPLIRADSVEFDPNEESAA